MKKISYMANLDKEQRYTLSKEICKKCRDSGAAFGEIGEAIDLWGVEDEYEWHDYGTVICKTDMSSEVDKLTSTSIFNDPPEWCPFKFEQSLARRLD